MAPGPARAGVPQWQKRFQPANAERRREPNHREISRRKRTRPHRTSGRPRKGHGDGRCADFRIQGHCIQLYFRYILSMNNLLAEGADVVRSAEASLRQLIQSAVNERQYDRVAVLARWAEQLAQVARNGSAHSATGPAIPTNASSSSKASLLSRKTSRKSQQARSSYPIFKRMGDNLIKIAWSKASKSEYRHQAPKDTAVVLLQKMQRLSHERDLITMNDVLPLTLDGRGGEVPAYQSYACLAWLREIGAVTQHGRKGYSVLSETSGHELVERSWLKLPLHRS